jgi:hypothetical protein
VRPTGATVRLRALWWDAVLPEEGDFLRTEAGRCYQVNEVRPTRPGSKSVATFVCTVLERDAVQMGEPGVWLWEYARR